MFGLRNGFPIMYVTCARNRRVALSDTFCVQVGWNQLPEIQDRFHVPPGGMVHDDSDPRLLNATGIYLEHCWPDASQIATRIHNVRRDWKKSTGGDLTHLHIMTNGNRAWVNDLKWTLGVDARQRRDKPWNHISSSLDLKLTKEQTHVSQAVDMAIAERATVFLGNGVSHLTSSLYLLDRALTTVLH